MIGNMRIFFLTACFATLTSCDNRELLEKADISALQAAQFRAERDKPAFTVMSLDAYKIAIFSTSGNPSYVCVLLNPKSSPQFKLSNNGDLRVSIWQLKEIAKESNVAPEVLRELVLRVHSQN